MDIKKIRNDFPILQKGFEEKQIIYFDNACQTLRPIQVIDKIKEYYEDYPACAGRSSHKLGIKVSEEVNNARQKIAKFIGAKYDEIAFTRNTTEGINLVSSSLNFKEGDIVLLSDKEHNSNLLPWQRLKKKGVIISRFKFGDIESFQGQLNKKVKLVATLQTSNIDGTSNPIEKMTKLTHDNGSLILVDAAQSVPHKNIDIKKSGIDFLAFSGHKMLGPSGTGALYMNKTVADQLEPFIVGGDTVIDTSYDSAVYDKPPRKFEAGLQDYAGIIGFGEAAEYLKRIGMESIEKHENRLNKKLTDALYDQITLLGPKEPRERSGIFSFNMKGIQHHDIALLLDTTNIMIRSGMHCVHSWFHANKVDGSARASLYFYNTEEECDIFIEEINKIKKLKR